MKENHEEERQGGKVVHSRTVNERESFRNYLRRGFDTVLKRCAFGLSARNSYLKDTGEIWQP